MYKVDKVERWRWHRGRLVKRAERLRRRWLLKQAWRRNPRKALFARELRRAKECTGSPRFSLYYIHFSQGKRAVHSRRYLRWQKSEALARRTVCCTSSSSLMLRESTDSCYLCAAPHYAHVVRFTFFPPSVVIYPPTEFFLFFIFIFLFLFVQIQDYIKVGCNSKRHHTERKDTGKSSTCLFKIASVRCSRIHRHI